MLFCCSYYLIIVIKKYTGGNPADEKFESVTGTYDNQEDGKPYITAVLPQDDSAKSRTEFIVGDGKYYSRKGVTNSKRKRRDVCKLRVQTRLFKSRIPPLVWLHPAIPPLSESLSRTSLVKFSKGHLLLNPHPANNLKLSRTPPVKMSAF